MSGAPIDPVQWIELVGIPMAKDVEGLKRALWTSGGLGVGAGTILGLIIPVFLKKMGWA